MKKTYQAEIPEIAKLVKDLEAFCDKHGIGDEILFAFSLCLDEIFSNIATYGYKNKGGEIEVEFLLEEGKMFSVIRDTAQKFDPMTVKDPNLDTSLDDREIGGLGIFFVKKNMDEVSYAYKNGGNELRIGKKLPC